MKFGNSKRQKRISQNSALPYIIEHLRTAYPLLSGEEVTARQDSKENHARKHFMTR